jgi:uncharacterized protein with ATP-grasp and redox domains
MKVTTDCFQCLQKSVYWAAELATTDEQVKAKAIREGLKTLAESFSPDKVSVNIAAEVHRVIREVTQNNDPYLEIKKKEFTVARELYPEIGSEYSNDLTDCLKLAAKGNAMDFFRPLETIEKDMKRPVKFAIDDSEQFLAKFRNSSKVLYLADNTAEVLFDLPLVTLMSQSTKVVYVVKGSPVLNDTTSEDLRRMGVEDRFTRVITTGTATTGIDFSSASGEFMAEFESADLVFAKGGANYQSLSELPSKGRFFHCLSTKCEPMANALKVPANSYVALLW